MSYNRIPCDLCNDCGYVVGEVIGEKGWGYCGCDEGEMLSGRETGWCCGQYYEPGELTAFDEAALQARIKIYGRVYNNGLVRRIYEAKSGCCVSFEEYRKGQEETSV